MPWLFFLDHYFSSTIALSINRTSSRKQAMQIATFFGIVDDSSVDKESASTTSKYSNWIAFSWLIRFIPSLTALSMFWSAFNAISTAFKVREITDAFSLSLGYNRLFLDYIANPMCYLWIGHEIILIPKLKSLTSCFTIKYCCKSFWPK